MPHPQRSASFLPRLAATLALGLSLATSAVAQDAEDRLAETIHRVEDRLDARTGVMVRDTGSDWTWAYRAEERFLMNSTVKPVICGAVLAEVDGGALTLDEVLPIRDENLLSYAPVTETRVGESMSIGDLCLATLDMSDNTAANLLMDRLGGPQEVTAFLRDIGDPVTRLDRREPELNTFAPGDPRDTTTPAAMLDTLQAMLLGDALTPASRAQLAEWMSRGGVTGALLRAEAPADWEIADKSGGGDQTRNIVAMVTPRDHAPWLVAIYLSDADVDFVTRNAALQEIGAAVMAVLKSR